MELELCAAFKLYTYVFRINTKFEKSKRLIKDGDLYTNYLKSAYTMGEHSHWYIYSQFLNFNEIAQTLNISRTIEKINTRTLDLEIVTRKNTPLVQGEDCN